MAAHQTSGRVHAEGSKPHPRGDRFKERIIQAFFDGIKHKPETTFGNVKADVLERMDPNYRH
jgi:hypothetical protein